MGEYHAIAKKNGMPSDGWLREYLLSKTLKYFGAVRCLLYVYSAQICCSLGRIMRTVKLNENLCFELAQKHVFTGLYDENRSWHGLCLVNSNIRSRLFFVCFSSVAHAKFFGSFLGAIFLPVQKCW